MTFDGPYRETVRSFLSAAYLPTDNPEWVGGLEERLAAIPDHVIVRAWQAMSAYEPTESLRRMKCPYLYIDSGQPDIDLDLVRELCPATGGGQDGGRRAQGAPGRARPDQRHAQPLHPTRRPDRRRDGPHRRGVPIQLPQDVRDGTGVGRGDAPAMASTVGALPVGRPRLYN